MCTETEFQCGSYCILKTWVCDGTADCAEAEDEQNCSADTTCSPDQFTCENGQCIEGHLRCNKDTDCIDLSDEFGCPPRKFQA